MSGATYRIDTTRDLTAEGWPYVAKVTRLSDDWPVHVTHGSTAELAEQDARRWINHADLQADEPIVTVYVDDHGVTAEPVVPMSLRVDG